MKEIISKKKILCNANDTFISYYKGNIYIQTGMTGTTSRLVKLPTSRLCSILCNLRLFERMFRLEPRLAISVDESVVLLSYQGSIYRIDISKGEIEKEHSYRESMNNPLSFCRGPGGLLYGEYFGNVNREEVCIFQRTDSGWRKVFSFEPGKIQHIHQIVFDKYRNCYWVLTGDRDKESAIWQMDIDFSKAKAIYIGKQKYRSCFLVPLENGIVYMTDTPLENNAVYFAKELSPNTWEEPTTIHNLPGPCIYGRIVEEDKIIFATSVEPDSRLPKWRYRVSNKLGPGVHDRFSHVFYGSVQNGFIEIDKGKKDLFPMLLFQFGNYQFPNIDKNCILLTGQSITHEDGKTIRVLP